MSKDYRVNVYESSMHEEVIARVRYNSNLDYWDGRNWCNGGVGNHLGLTKLRDGTYVLIFGTDWQGQKDYAETVSKKQALQEILKSGNSQLLKTKKFANLNDLYKKINNLESGEADE